MPREHGDDGAYVETVPLERVLEEFDAVDGPVILSADVADALGCSRETARRKLQQLYERGDLDRRKVSRRVIYWRAERDGFDTADADAHATGDAGAVETTPNDTNAESGRTRGESDVVAEVLDGWPPVGERKREQRRQAGSVALEYLREVGGATARDVKENAEPDAPVDGQSPDTWWKKTARPAFKQAEDAGLVTFTDGSKVWEWVGQ
ncbi:hypothetical protein Halar_0014 (plasmid) [halophilic archaeon DL31]|jgi:hypothetical protein|nr:hypothetical protein Halar_0014 [halophilic archaeon DL31]